MPQHVQSGGVARPCRAQLEREADKLLAIASAAEDSEEAREAKQAKIADEAILAEEGEPLKVSFHLVKPHELAELSDERVDDFAVQDFEQETALAEKEYGAAAKSSRKAEALLVLGALEPHTREILAGELFGLRQAIKYPTSDVALHLDTEAAERIAKRLGRSDFLKTVAVMRKVSLRTAERWASKGRIIRADIIRAATNLSVTPGQLNEVIGAMSPDMQIKVAHEAERRRWLWQFEEEQKQYRRPPKLTESILRELDAIHSNDAATRQRFSVLTLAQQTTELVSMRAAFTKSQKRKDAIAKLRGERLSTILTPAADALGTIYAAATPADRARFLEVHGLRRAPTIAGEEIGIAFSVVEEAEQTNA
jgi:hypothetical protein